MVASDFKQKVELWLTDKPGKAKRAYRGMQALRHNRLPRKLRLWGVLHWGTRTAMASSAPIVAAFFYNSISTLIALAAAGAIFLGHSFVSMFDSLSKEKDSQIHNNASEIIIRFGEIISALKSNTTPPTDTDDSIRSALGVIEVFARQITKSTQGSIAVSLVLYNGNSSSEMKIRHRNPGNTRPLNKTFPGEMVVGYHACNAGRDPRVVHDLRGFGPGGMKSPTQTAVNYRSLFIIPVVVTKGDESKTRGFISIDSTRPYAFYGNRANVIIVTCEPVINHIQDLL